MPDLVSATWPNRDLAPRSILVRPLTLWVAHIGFNGSPIDLLDLDSSVQLSRHGQIIRQSDYHFLAGTSTLIDGLPNSLLDDKLLIITENVVQSSP